MSEIIPPWTCRTQPPPLFFRSQKYHQSTLLCKSPLYQNNNNEWKMSQYTINDNTNCLNTTNSFNKVWNNCTFNDDPSQLLTWLSPLDPSLRHCDIRERRVNDIGGWLMQTEEFRRWGIFGGDGQGHEPVLFCYGDRSEEHTSELQSPC